MKQVIVAISVKRCHQLGLFSGADQVLQLNTIAVESLGLKFTSLGSWLPCPLDSCPPLDPPLSAEQDHYTAALDSGYVAIRTRTEK